MGIGVNACTGQKGILDRRPDFGQDGRSQRFIACALTVLLLPFAELSDRISFAPNEGGLKQTSHYRFAQHPDVLIKRLG